jgi:hypothetical protein
MTQTQNQSLQDFEAATKTLPLVRSIARELKDRVRRIALGEARRRRLVREDGDLSTVDARLAVDRRELRHAGKELDRLGWKVESELPLRLAYETGDEGPEVTWRPEETGYHRVRQAPEAT